MPAICTRETLAAANRFRRLWTLYQQNQDLIKVGAYQAGANAELDEAILRRSEMETFLRQDMHVGVEIGATVDFLKTFSVAGGS